MAAHGNQAGSRSVANGSGGSMAARRTLARKLRELRKAAGVTQEDAAEVLGRRVTKMHKLENGLPGATLAKPEIKALVELYEVTDPEVAGQLATLAAATKVKGPYQPYRDVVSADFDMYLGLERDAVKMLSYDDDLLPGLVQTETYARLLISLPGGDGKPRQQAEVDKRVQLRLKRQSMLTREDDPLLLDVILAESVLHRLVGDTSAKVEQLRHLLALTDLPNVTLRIVPTGPQVHLGRITGQFIVLRFPGDEPPFAYSDGYLGGNYFKEPEEITRYEEAFNDISKHALDPDGSRALIERAAKETS